MTPEQKDIFDRDDVEDDVEIECAKFRYHLGAPRHG